MYIPDPRILPANEEALPESKLQLGHKAVILSVRADAQNAQLADLAKTRHQPTAVSLRGEESIAALCRREGIAESLYYSWSKEFL